MLRTLLFSALVVLSSAQSSTSQITCTQSTITIASPAQATLPCDVANTLVIVDQTVTTIDIEGPTQIDSLIVNNASSLVSLTSSSITSMTGLFSMSNLNALSTLQFSSLTSVGAIDWVALNQLNGVTFGTQGVTQVPGNITISDTFMGSLDGLNLLSVTNMDVNNNRKLVEWNSGLSTINGTLKLQSNGAGQIVINMLNLTSVGDMEVRDVQEFNAPLLRTVVMSINFEENENMQTFSAPNLTSVGELSFVDNAVLTNISMPLLTETTNGAFTIQNNTNFDVINGFPKLSTVHGAMILRGSFSKVSLPSLQNVFGQGVITSTKDITSSCAFFNNLISNQDIQGEGSECTSNNDQANAGGNNGTTNSGGGGNNGNNQNSAVSFKSTNILVAIAFSAAGSIVINLF